ncbi:MAG: hypothetical protein M3355_04140, partial [Actinomycetota bacterium]|nr:hypothetical protein [Actinomycetota bacterium]
MKANLGTGLLTPGTAKLRGERKSQICRDRRRAWQEEGRSAARRGDALHRAGCMLYWAEGAKERNRVTFANSDANMVRVFAAFLRESLRVPNEDFTVRLNVYLGNGLSIEEVEKCWLRNLDLPRSCLRGHQVDHFPTSSSGKKVNRLPYGVCALRVKRSTWIVQHIFGAIQEYAGFEEANWLG